MPLRICSLWAVPEDSTVTRSSGETPVSIPEETKRLFEAAGITKAEDQAKEYRKYLKQLKG